MFKAREVEFKMLNVKLNVVFIVFVMKITFEYIAHMNAASGCKNAGEVE